MWVQMTLFGTDIKVDEIEQKKARSHKTKTMQEMYGTLANKTCKSCAHCYAFRQSRVWYKCRLWDRFFRGRSSASDIRLKNPACNKYKEREKE